VTTNERVTDDEHRRPGIADSAHFRDPSDTADQRDGRGAVDADAPTVDAGDTVTVEEHRTERWYGIGMLALLGLGVGVLTDTAARAARERVRTRLRGLRHGDVAAAGRSGCRADGR